MKLLLLPVFSFSCCFLYGQSFREVNDNLNQFMTQNKKNDSAMSWIKSIISKRDTFYMKKKIEAATAEKVKIVEVYNRNTKEYGLKEEYLLNNRIEYIYRDKLEDSFYNSLKKNYKTQLNITDTFQSAITYFSPNTIEALCGCGQVAAKIKRRCIKLSENTAKKDGVVSEQFARLVTYINKTNGQIHFVLELPAKGQRKVYYGISPDTNNRRWYD